MLLSCGFFSCKKNKITCLQYTNTKVGFKVFEYVLDTLMLTDSVYIDNNIFFITNENYTNVSWKIGRDSRTFYSQKVNLRFDEPQNLKLLLNAAKVDRQCNAIEESVTCTLSVLNNNGTIISPLAGKYRGYNFDTPSDFFTIEIKFWKGERYEWWKNGAYSVENLPKGYINPTQNWNSNLRPEIKGIIASNGYKNLAIDMTGNLPALGIKGYATLKIGSYDSLIFNYTIIDTAILNKTGKTTIIQKQFIGIRK